MDVRIDLTQPAPTKTEFRSGMYVLYRDPAKYLTGQDGHTAVYRVNPQSDNDIANLHFGHAVPIEDLSTGQVRRVDPAYVRAVPAAEVMRDVDEAPLDDPAEFQSAAGAWLRGQQTEGGEVR